MRADVDLLVAGGGPVGLAVAIAAALRGLEAVVVEPRSGPIDKACGESLTPGAVAQLAAWGIRPAGAPIAGFRYADGRRTAEHRIATGGGLGVRRPVLHAALLERAGELGVPVRRASVDAFSERGGVVQAGGLTARCLVGADGLHSRIRRLAGLAGAPSRLRRYGLRRHYRLRPWTDLVEVHWLVGAELYATPVDDDTVGVAVLGPRGTTLETALAACPGLGRRLAGAAPVGGLRGAGPLRQRARARVAGRVALVGDAAGYVDALTGEGLATGFAGAAALVDAVVADDLPSYERRWRAVSRPQRLLTQGLLALAASPLRAAVVPAAAALPGAFGTVVERLAGVAPPSVPAGRMGA